MGLCLSGFLKQNEEDGQFKQDLNQDFQNISFQQLNNLNQKQEKDMLQKKRHIILSQFISSPYQHSVIQEESQNQTYQSQLNSSLPSQIIKMSMDSNGQTKFNGDRVSGTKQFEQYNIDYVECVEITSNTVLNLKHIVSQQFLVSRAIKVKKMPKFNEVKLVKDQEDYYENWQLQGESGQQIKSGNIIIIHHVVTGRNLTVNGNRIVCGETEQNSVSDSHYWKIKLVEDSDYLNTNCSFQIIHVVTQLILVSECKGTSQVTKLRLSQYGGLNSAWVAQSI